MKTKTNIENTLLALINTILKYSTHIKNAW